MIGQTFTLIGQPETRVPPCLARKHRRHRLASRGVALNGKFQTLRRAADVVFVEAA